MSHEDIVFNGNIFVDNLKFLLRYKKSDITAGVLTTRTYMDTAFLTPIPPKTAAAFLSTIATDTNPFVDWESFLQAWKSYATTDTTNNLLEHFLTDFKAQIGYVDGNPSGGDWHVLSEDVQGVGHGVTDQMIENYFKRSFSHFLESYPYILATPNDPGSRGTVGTTTTAGDNFFTEWTKYMARSAEFDNSTSGVADTPAAVDLAAYENVYSVFFPLETGETQAQAEARYVARIRKFFEKITKENGAGSLESGWFIPSHSFDEWFEDLREEFIKDSTKSSLMIHTTVSAEGAHKILVIDRILRLLVDMVDILQRISAAQAQRLSFLTNWQQAYTQMVTDVPQFSQGDGSPLTGSSDAAKFYRNSEVNPKMQAILERVRARRSNVQDDAKQMQTTINATQDAANQQTQMATSLLQQLSTILGQIFR